MKYFCSSGSSFAYCFPLYYSSRFLYLITWSQVFEFLLFDGAHDLWIFFHFSEYFYVWYVSCPWYSEHSHIQPHFKCFHSLVVASVNVQDRHLVLLHHVHLGYLIFISRDRGRVVTFEGDTHFVKYSFSMRLFISSALSHCSFITVPK